MKQRILYALLLIGLIALSVMPDIVFNTGMSYLGGIAAIVGCFAAVLLVVRKINKLA